MLLFHSCSPCLQSIQAQFKRFPKIPVELLHDTSRSGPIYHLGAICHQARLRNPNIKRVELTNPAQRAQVGQSGHHCRGYVAAWACIWPASLSHAGL